ncbi:uncharacterized protein LOC143023532 [Oratosquilla oratoria]|uniref:uncharacterized protein LOC143023532 n=1 Tax=Oratosquilla oratoria TaxID=337810 RepID=UPI003F76DE71
MSLRGSPSGTTRHLSKLLPFFAIFLLEWSAGAVEAAAANEVCEPIFLSQVDELPSRPLPSSVSSSVQVGVKPPQIKWGNLTFEFEGEGRTLRLNLSCLNSVTALDAVGPIQNTHLRMATLELLHRKSHGRRGPSGPHVHLLRSWPILLESSAWNNFSLELSEDELVLNTSATDQKGWFSFHRVAVKAEDLDSFKSATVRCSRPCGVHIQLPCSPPKSKEPVITVAATSSSATSLGIMTVPIAAMIVGFLVLMTLCLGLLWCQGKSKLAAQRRRHQEMSRVRWSSSVNDLPDGGGNGGSTGVTVPSYIALETSETSTRNGFANDAFRSSALQIS